VVGLIAPWNFPLTIACMKLAPALAAGCSCVVKPAEQTSLTTLRLGELILEAGIPPGVVNIVTGFGETAGAAISAHPDIDKVSFPGSTEVGRLVVQAALGNLKKVTLELGGKSPVVVLDDADIDSAIAGASIAIFANSGQICSAGTRLYVQRKSFDRVVAGVADAARKLKLGNGFDATTDMGPLISAEQRDRVMDYVEGGLRVGAEAVVGCKRFGDKGYFVEPTILVNTTQDMRVVQEEIFGPVLTAMPIEDIGDVPMLANNSPFGLAAAIWTRDLNTAHLFAEAVQSGSVWVNCYHMVVPQMPFGGFKQSGWGRENGYDGILNFLQTKSVVIQLQE
jgi:phenylacetaldehyde dehydrogenase